MATDPGLDEVVLDTNVFVAAGFNPGSHSARLVEAVRDRRLRMIWDEATREEALQSKALVRARLRWWTSVLARISWNTNVAAVPGETSSSIAYWRAGTPERLSLTW